MAFGFALSGRGSATSNQQMGRVSALFLLLVLALITTRAP